MNTYSVTAYDKYGLRITKIIRARNGDEARIFMKTQCINYITIETVKL